MPESCWNRPTLEARIADVHARQRHAGGSPDAAEIAAYDAALGVVLDFSGTALVLGMTPELRNLALKRFSRLISADANPASIALYRDWVPAAEQARETIVQANWFALRAAVTQPVSAVLADGVFGNLPDLAAHEALLQTIASLLSPRGRFVTRKIMIPDGFNASDHSSEVLLRRFRAREIDEAEFGFGMRLVGHYADCYDRLTSRLDNAQIFQRCAARHAAGVFTDAEHAAIRHYYFGGHNCIVSQRDWEHALRTSGWEFQIHRCQGKAWYEYFPIYSCWRKEATA